MLMYKLRWEVIHQNFDMFTDGLKLGLKMAIISLLIGSAIGLIFAFGKANGPRAVRLLVTGYVEIIRNVPLLLIVYLLYFGLPQAFPRGSTGQEIVLRLLPDGETTFIVSLSVYAGAYLTEVFFAGIVSVSKRYLEAGRALGLSRIQLAQHVTVPVMARTVLPSLSNTFISLFKDTSIAVAIAVPELTWAARKISTDTFRVLEAWLTAGALYLVTCYTIALVLRFLEGRIKWSV